MVVVTHEQHEQDARRAQEQPVHDPTAPHAGANRDLFGAFTLRRTITRYAPRPVEIDKILQVIQAGTLAPSSGNLQNWAFIVVTDLDVIRSLYHHTLDQEAFLSATAAVVVVGDEDHAHRLYGMRGRRLYTVQNCAAAIQNMLLCATALGLGTTWVGAFDEEKAVSLFGIPPNYRPQAIILMGYPAEVPVPKSRKPLESLVFFNKFGNRVQRPHLMFYDWATEWRLQAQKAQGHARHILAASTPRRAEVRAAAERTKEQASASLLSAKERVRSILENLKHEEYRNRGGDRGSAR